MTTEPLIKVGIITAPSLAIRFNGQFTDSSDGSKVSGDMTFSYTGKCDPHRTFTPTDPGSCSFEISDVTIGVDFHWQRHETQRFSGALSLKPHNGKLIAINLIAAEDYLKSVISSEMSAQASTELLKAHAVISRSWLIAMLQRDSTSDQPDDRMTSDKEMIMWWDREDHTEFDVCADDHCQRYQGISRMSQKAVEAVAATRGEVLTDQGQICDARFSKCCGGAFEQFENCWAPVHHRYLTAGSDRKKDTLLPDLRVESNARQWIMSQPDAFCNTDDTTVLDQVMNNYDRETSDFYRWSVEYDQRELSTILHNRTGIDFGQIIDLVPEARGTSGRIYRLTIIGTKRSMTIGKELAIRRALSTSHLYSSAFVVERHGTDNTGLPLRFALHGAGWGHGVGLCQIGAAMMGEQGYNYHDILLHYYRGASIQRIYK